MKEALTKFGLEAAFKALDDMPVPTATHPVDKATKIQEATKRIDRTTLLLEDYYTINDTKELESAKEDREADIAKAKLARIEKIVDLDAKSSDDLLGSYVGKAIVQCPQCMNMFYKDVADINRDENDPNTVNIGEICQHCGNDSGYAIIGKVAAVAEDERDDFSNEQADQDQDQTGEAATDSNKESDENADSDSAEDKTADAEAESDNADLNLDVLDTDTDQDSASKSDELKAEALAGSNSLYASVTSENLTLNEAGDGIGDTSALASKLSAAIDAAAANLTESAPSQLTEATSSLSDAEISELFASDEFTKPISAGEVDDIIAAESLHAYDINEALADVEEFDDAALEECISNTLTDVYENVQQFTLTDCCLNESGLLVSGNILFKSGKQKATTYLFNEAAKDSTSTIKLTGLNEDFGPGTKFTIVGSTTAEHKIITESISYQYMINNTEVKGFIQK